ncbi:MAG: OB-fold nucleic acid binding domain-containing protein [Promethearchaeota archaeon]
MALKITKTRYIKDITAQDDKIWIYGKITSISSSYLIMDDGTGTLQINLDDSENVEEKHFDLKTLSKGKIIRIYGQVMSRETNTIHINPIIIQNLTEMNLNQELLERIRKLEDNIWRNMKNE